MWSISAVALALSLPAAAYASEQKTEHAAKPESHGEAEAGHGHGTGPEREKMAERAARTSSRDVKVPRALVGKIEADYRAFLAKQPGTPKKEIKRSLLNINAELTQKNVAALHENTRVKTPTGGGVIDLSEVVTPVRGAFRLKLDAVKENGEPLGNGRVYFVSRAKTRTVGGEDYGGGCDKYMDITSVFNKKYAGHGFELYTADQRYVSVVGGTFIFTDYSPEALHVGSVTFTDSRYPALLCE